MRFWELEDKIRKRLAKAGVESPGLCARLLICHIAQIPSDSFLASLDREFPDSLLPTLDDLALRCEKGEPLAYLICKRDFYANTFLVSDAVLIPRPETELLVETALTLLPRDELFFADIGSGSGCIGLSLLAERNAWKGFLLDNNEKALTICKLNAENLRLSPYLIHGDLFHLPFMDGSLQLIIANPPYISPAEMETVMPQVLAYEPHSALFSEYGLAHIKSVIFQGQLVLCRGGFLILEHGYSQQPDIITLLQNEGYINIKTFKDLAGLPRCVVAQKK